MPIASLSSIDVYYEIHGQGSRVFYIGGSGGDLRVRPNIFDGPLTEQFEVLSFDQRGLGQSGKPEAEYTMADYASDAAELLAYLNWTQVPVVGVSFGGMVAQELALSYPQCVSALALACTSSGGEGGASYPLHELAKLEPQTRAERHLEQSDLRRDDAWRQQNPQRWQKLMDKALTAGWANKDESGAARQLAARAQHDTYERLPQLSMPVLIQGGRYDGIAPVANQQALATQIPQTQMRMYEGGHLFLIQDKSAFPDLVQWLTLNASNPTR